MPKCQLDLRRRRNGDFLGATSRATNVALAALVAATWTSSSRAAAVAVVVATIRIALAAATIPSTTSRGRVRIHGDGKCSWNLLNSTK